MIDHEQVHLHDVVAVDLYVVLVVVVIEAVVVKGVVVESEPGSAHKSAWVEDPIFDLSVQKKTKNTFTQWKF